MEHRTSYFCSKYRKWFRTRYEQCFLRPHLKVKVWCVNWSNTHDRNYSIYYAITSIVIGATLWREAFFWSNATERYYTSTYFITAQITPYKIAITFFEQIMICKHSMLVKNLDCDKSQIKNLCVPLWYFEMLLDDITIFIIIYYIIPIFYIAVNIYSRTFCAYKK